MQATDTLDKRTAARLSAHLSAHGARASSAHFGLHHSAIRKAAEGRAVSVRTLSVINAKLKTEDDYKLPKTVAIATQRKKPSVSWPLDAVRSARDAQLAGDFAKAAPLGTAMRLDDAIFTAHYNRTAPIGSLNLAVDSAGTTRGDAIAKKAKDLVTVDRSVLLSLESTLVLHGVAFGHVEAETLADGEEIAMTVKEWPIEFVKWDELLGCYTTSAEGQSERVQIVHGDGEWIVFAKQDTLPHQHEACILPGALIFAAHLDAVRAWNASSTSHGQAKLIGELPEGVPLQDPDQDTLSPEASAFLAMLSDVISGESGAGIRPAGSKTDFVANGSSAWQVFSELAMNREKAAARVWLGNDGVLGSVGGAPGVDIATLFGVATTKVQGDVDAIEKGLYEGLYVPWTAVNFGEARLAPRLRFEIPDADAAQKNEQKQAARAAFFEALDLLKKNNMVVDQDVVDALAEEYGIDPPTVAQATEQTVSLVLAPTDVAKVVRVAEARASQGLAPFGDDRDNMTLTELDEKIKADAAARSAVAPTATVQDSKQPVGPATLNALSTQPREQDGKFGGVPGAGDDAPKGDGQEAAPEEKKAAVKDRVTKARDADRKRVETSKARLSEAEPERKAIAKRVAGIDKEIDRELGPEKVKALDELEIVNTQSSRLGQRIEDAESGKRAVSPEGIAVARDLPNAKRQKTELDTRAGELKTFVGEPSPRALQLREEQGQLDVQIGELDSEIEGHRAIVKGAAKREKAFADLDAAVEAGDRNAVVKAQTRVAALIEDSEDGAFDNADFAGLSEENDIASELFGEGDAE